MDVGPDSVGSSPGPVCYGRGGATLAVTDANFLLGRILPRYFPFALDYDRTRAAFERRAAEINASRPASAHLSVEEVAHGYLELANARMASAIGKVTEAKGYDVQEHTLVVFGGAGPQHACALARSLGITNVPL